MNLDKFAKSWNPEPKRGLRERMRDMFDKQPLRYKLMIANYKIKAIITRLEAQIAKLKERDTLLFERVVEALRRGDKQHAAIYASEVAEIRKAIKHLMTVKLALEQVTLRLETFMAIGDVATALAPVVGVIHELRNYVRGVMPMLSLEFMELEETLGSVVAESGDFIALTGGSVAASAEARKILQEAAILAEQKLREQFPEAPLAATNAVEEGVHA